MFAMLVYSVSMLIIANKQKTQLRLMSMSFVRLAFGLKVPVAKNKYLTS